MKPNADERASGPFRVDADGTAHYRCSKCIGRGYIAKVRPNGRTGYTRRPGFTARTCYRCGGTAAVRATAAEHAWADARKAK